jgi:hypothetical protein
MYSGSFVTHCVQGPGGIGTCCSSGRLAASGKERLHDPTSPEKAGLTPQQANVKVREKMGAGMTAAWVGVSGGAQNRQPLRQMQRHG